jgi:hypothetical protein
MGHYASEMGYGERELTKEEIKDAKRREQIEKQLCKILKVRRGELKVVYNILKECWNYDSNS